MRTNRGIATHVGVAMVNQVDWPRSETALPDPSSKVHSPGCGSGGGTDCGRRGDPRVVGHVRCRSRLGLAGIDRRGPRRAASAFTGPLASNQPHALRIQCRTTVRHATC